MRERPRKTNMALVERYNKEFPYHLTVLDRHGNRELKQECELIDNQWVHVDELLHWEETRLSRWILCKAEIVRSQGVIAYLTTLDSLFESCFKTRKKWDKSIFSGATSASE